MTESSHGKLYGLSERVTWWLARAASIGLALMMLLTLADVIGRTFGHPIVGAVEITELIMGMMIYLAIGYTTMMRGHIRVDILITMLKPRTQALMDIITVLISIAFSALICWRLILQADSRVENNDLTQIWELPIWPAAFVMAISSLLLVTSLLFQLHQSINVVLGKEEIATLAPAKSKIEG